MSLKIMNGMGMSLLELIEYTMPGDIVACTARRHLGSSYIHNEVCIWSRKPAKVVHSLSIPPPPGALSE